MSEQYVVRKRAKRWTSIQPFVMGADLHCPACYEVAGRLEFVYANDTDRRCITDEFLIPDRMLDTFIADLERHLSTGAGLVVDLDGVVAEIEAAGSLAAARQVAKGWAS